MSFTCLRCAECCSWRGFVHLSGEDADRIAAYLGVGVYDFTSRYTRLSGDRLRLSLTEKENGECVFLDGDTCGIYPARPRQCADFPTAWTVEGIEHVCDGAMRQEKTYN